MLSSLYPAFTSLMAWDTRLKGLVITTDSTIAMAVMITIIRLSRISALRPSTSMFVIMDSLEMLVSITAMISPVSLLASVMSVVISI